MSTAPSTARYFDTLETVGTFTVGRGYRFENVRGKWAVTDPTGSSILGNWRNTPEEAVADYTRLQLEAADNAAVEANARKTLERALAGATLTEDEWTAAGYRRGRMTRTQAVAALRVHGNMTRARALEIVLRIPIAYTTDDGATIYSAAAVFHVTRSILEGREEPCRST